jgi:hypothetical protein
VAGARLATTEKVVTVAVTYVIEGGRREKERGGRGSCGFKFPMSRVNQTDVT